jgi:hypothetical protein
MVFMVVTIRRVGGISVGRMGREEREKMAGRGGT